MSLSVSSAVMLLSIALSLTLGGCASSAPRASATAGAERPSDVLEALQAPQSRAPATTARAPTSARQRPTPTPSRAATQPKAVAARAAVVANLPRREPAQILRLWIAPWEDASGNLHGASEIYTELLPRRWRIDDPAMPAATARLRPLQIEPRNPAAVPR
jgi:conjugal transfer pilus assembly protein TraV